MSDTNTQTQDATSQDKLAKKPEGSEATGTQHEPTAYMTKEKMESMVPWEFIPMQLPNYGWCQVKIADYGLIAEATHMCTEKKYLTLRQTESNKVECFVRQMHYTLVHSEHSVKVSGLLDSWDQNIFVEGMFAIACVCFVRFVEFSFVIICLVCIFAVEAYNRALFRAPENWVKYNAAMVEYKSKVKLAANASASLDILVRAAGRGHRIRQPAKRYAFEVVHVCL